jgi:hypothetical protein
MSAVGFAFIVSLGLLHIYAGRLRWIERVPERQWLSFGAGISIAYVFVDVLPMLSAGQATLAETTGTILEQLKHRVYLVALLGLVAFYSLELLAKRARADNREKALHQHRCVLGACQRVCAL